MLHNGKPWADLEFALAGEYNVWNATAAAALAASCGIPNRAIAAALKTFKSVKRRLEVKAQVNGITIIDDFAHHPTAIAGTLKALRARYPGRGYGPFLSRVRTLCAAAFCRAIWPAASRKPTKSSSRAYSAPKQFPKMSAWSCPRWPPRSNATAAPRAFSPMPTRSCKLSLPKCAAAMWLRFSPMAASEEFTKNFRHACANWQGSDEVPIPRLRRVDLPARCAWRVALPCRAFVRRGRAVDNRLYVSLASPEQHLVDVQIILPAGPAQRELQLPVWNALYQIRDFSQYVNWVRAQRSRRQPLPLRELNKSRWQVHGAERRSDRGI